MQFRKLGATEIDVSLICLGTMTWGSQNSEAEAHAQIDYALDQGVNFLDTAEGYPVTPVSAETTGRTEEYIGSWIAQSGKRDRIVLATKVAGPGRPNDVRKFRGGNNRLDRRNITQAIDDSLRRLRTDYVDLYQLHWPDRPVASFGGRGISRVDDPAETVPIEETLSALGDLIKAGKVRHIGVSNENPWGVCEYLRLARDQGLPRIVSIQNAYNLLNRVFEIGLSEFALREQVGLLAYSPLAARRSPPATSPANISAARRRPDHAGPLPASSSATTRWASCRQALVMSPSPTPMASIRRSWRSPMSTAGRSSHRRSSARRRSISCASTSAASM
jgi:aryl-alcohol dehydrogenase-like predicted oxidoreductase